MTLPKTTRRQQDIIQLLYQFRFLNRIHIQALLGHKDRKTINMWLRDLTAKQYVGRIFSRDRPGVNEAATYYLGINGVRYLRSLGQYPAPELRKRYREASRQSPFITSCLLLGDCAVNLQAQSASSTQYDFATQADIADPRSTLHLLAQISCQLFVKKRRGQEVTRYLFDIFDAALPPYRVRSRIRQHLAFYRSSEWEERTETEFPILMLICPDTSRLITAKRHTRRLLKDDDQLEGLHVRFATAGAVRQAGVTSGIWEEV